MPNSDDDRYTEFVQAASGRLFRTAYAVCGDYQLAEDALQAALATAYSRWRRVSRADNPEAYVQRMVLNQVFSWRRRAWVRREVSSSDLHQERPHPSPESALADQDEVWRALATLHPKHRAVLVLRFVEDLSVADTARVLGLHEGTVKSQTSRAVARLREQLLPASASFEGGAR